VHFFIGENMKYTLFLGDCLDRLKSMEDNSVHSVVTDPPYGLSDLSSDKIVQTMKEWSSGNLSFIPKGKGFMNKDWDSFVPPPAVWIEVLRVLKPGGHILCFAGSRTMDLMSLSLRIAGFEIRDTVMWLYGSGFPKSHDVSKALDKVAGVERELVPATGSLHKNSNLNDDNWSKIGDSEATMWSNNPITDQAKQWNGWGTALKPAVEPIILSRKPLEGSVANNVAKWGTGALNIQGSRIGSDIMPALKAGQARLGTFEREDMITPERVGRWPANLILDEEAAELLDNQSGHSTSKASSNRNGNNVQGVTGIMAPRSKDQLIGHSDSGGASRFFYVAKTTGREREAGLDSLEEKFIAKGNQAQAELKRGNTDFSRDVDTAGQNKVFARKNHHPTVKPIKLMTHLCTLVTPENGIVLDPFMGSGSTGIAAVTSGFNFIGIEMNEEYVEIARLRIEHHSNNKFDI
jgi:site-specific DNA-methyltransferase (adenine-specific)